MWNLILFSQAWTLKQGQDLWTFGRYPYEGSEAVSPESSDESVRRLSRSRNPRSSWSAERPQVLSLLQCSGLAEWNQFPHLALYSADIVHVYYFFSTLSPNLKWLRLGDFLSPLFQKALERAKALFIARYFKAFALTGRIVDCHYTQGDALG